MKRLIKSWVKWGLRRMGLELYSLRAHGRDDIHDLRRVGGEFNMIFDVGANIGQSVRKFKRAFPGAVIHSFEPVSTVYATLQSEVGMLDKLHLHRLALGAVSGRAQIRVRANNTMHTMVKVNDAVYEETVEVQTVDLFCSTSGISGIDLLKIDVEGFDLEVLRGAVSMLQAGAIRFVLVECGYDPDDTRHSYFESVRAFLYPFGYRLFGVYEQQLEYGGELRLRFANVCFCMQPDIEQQGGVELGASLENGANSLSSPRRGARDGR
ncbi:MAG: FkbM family methyltransferase [Kiritimatiellia bacterium]